MMTAGTCLEHGALLALSCQIGLAMSAPALDLIPVGSYEVTVETNMPHLDENLRYMTTRENKCLANLEFSKAFPVLGHPSLAHCKLNIDDRNEEERSYLLVCEGNAGTTGYAEWQRTDHQIVGTLQVKLGGKNMTFSQRVTAKRLGACD